MRARAALVGLLVLICLLVLGGCGSSSSTKKSSASSSGAASSPGAPQSTGASLNISIKEVGPKAVAFTAPPSISGGLVNVQLTNSGRKAHVAQIIKVDPGHTVQDAYKIIAGNSNKSPAWLHGAGGIGGTGPGATNRAQVVLSAGTYYILDAGMSSSKGFATLKVQGGDSAAALPSTTASITARETGSKKSKFEVSGLKAGDNAIRFQSPASNRDLHQFAAIPLRPGATLAEVKKFLASPGKPTGPPPFAGRPGAGGHDAAVIDPGLGEVANINLKAGSSYALVCFLSDREGGPPHFTQGMLTKVDIK